MVLLVFSDVQDISAQDQEEMDNKNVKSIIKKSIRCPVAVTLTTNLEELLIPPILVSGNIYSKLNAAQISTGSSPIFYSTGLETL